MSKDTQQVKPLRVLFAHTNSDPFGGSDLSLFALVTGLDRSKIHPVVVLPPGPMTLRYKETDVEFYTIPMAPLRRSINPVHHFRYAFGYSGTVRGIRRIIRAEKIDVVYLNTALHIYAARAARRERIPIIWHIREIAGANRFIVMLIKEWAQKVITNSEAVKEIFGLDHATVVHNGIEISRFDNPKTSIRRHIQHLGDHPYAAIVSRIDTWKGHTVFIHAAREVHDQMSEARFLIVGGPVYSRPHLLDRLKKLVLDLRLEDVVFFTGPRDDVPGILNEATVIACPSTEPEPFGRVVIEAMAASRPVIASRAGGHLETMIDGETGYLVESGSSHELAARMIELFEDPEKGRRMGETGRERVLKHFTLDQYVENVQRVILG